MDKNRSLLARLRAGEKLSFKDRVALILKLSVPAILAELSSIVMQYIDASMVGQLGAHDSAAIGLVASTTWLFGGLTHALATGFTVLVAHKIGAEDEKAARQVVKNGLLLSFLFSVFLTVIAAGISGVLPGWLGGRPEIRESAGLYFLVYMLFLPIMQLTYTCAGMLEASGNMKVPSAINIGMCFLDVVFNYLLIFPGGTHTVFGATLYLPGADLGIFGAALGTGLAELCGMTCMVCWLLFKERSLKLRREEKKKWFSGDVCRSAVKLAVPIGIESAIMGSAYVMLTHIVAPVGVAAVAAHSFAVTAESLCYMPGYGIGHAATTVVGQSVGAGRKKTARQLGWLNIALGMLFMAATGALMYVFAPQMMQLLTPDREIIDLGVTVLRIEAFAEPLYGASIVASGVFKGMGKTGIPSVLNLISVWLVRIPLAAYLTGSLGLMGVWIAMCIELNVRGLLFLISLIATGRKDRGQPQAAEKSLN